MIIDNREKQIVKSPKLLEQELNKKTVLHSGRNWLHYVANSGSLKSLEYLLKKGVDPDKVDQISNLPIDYAIKNQRKDIFEILKKHTKSRNWAFNKKAEEIVKMGWIDIWDWQAFAKTVEPWSFSTITDSEKQKKLFGTLPLYFEYIETSKQKQILESWLRYSYKQNITELKTIIKCIDKVDFSIKKLKLEANQIGEDEAFKIMKSFLHTGNWHVSDLSHKDFPSLLAIYLIQKNNKIIPQDKINIKQDMIEKGFDLTFKEDENDFQYGFKNLSFILKLIDALKAYNDDTTYFINLVAEIQNLQLSELTKDKQSNKLKIL